MSGRYSHRTPYQTVRGETVHSKASASGSLAAGLAQIASERLSASQFGEIFGPPRTSEADEMEKKKQQEVAAIKKLSFKKVWGTFCEKNRREGKLFLDELSALMGQAIRTASNETELRTIVPYLTIVQPNKKGGEVNKEIEAALQESLEKIDGFIKAKRRDEQSDFLNMLIDILPRSSSVRNALLDRRKVLNGFFAPRRVDPAKLTGKKASKGRPIAQSDLSVW